MGLFLLNFSTSYCQEPPHWQLTDEDGLPSMTVYNIVQDDMGYIWIGTAAGLCRYDGKDFKYYRHPEQADEEIMFLITDVYGRIWFSNLSGQIFTIRDEKVNLVKPLFDKSKHRLDYLKPISDRIAIGLSKITIDDGSKFLILSIDSTSIIKKIDTIPNPIADVSSDEKRNYILESFKKVNSEYYEGLKLQTLKLKSDDSFEKVEVLSNQEIISKHIGPFRFVQNDNSLLFFRSAGKLIYLNPKKNLFQEKINIGFEILNAAFHSNKLYFATRDGILIYGKDDFKLKTHFFKEQIVYNIFIDKEENLWACTNSGVLIIPENNLNFFNSENCPIETIAVNSLNNAGERTIAGTKNGELFFLKNGKLEFTKQNSALSYIYEIIQNKADDNLLIATNEGVFPMTQEGKLLIDRTPSGTQSIKTVSIDKINRLWMGNYKSTVYFDAGTPLKNIDYREGNSVIKQRTYTIYPDFENTVWIGTTQGLYSFSEENLNPVMIEGEHKKFYFTKIIQNPSDSSIWASTHGDGLLQIKKNKDVHLFKEEDFLVSNLCNDMHLDEHNNLWLATNLGVQKINLVDKSSQIINKYDGLPTNEISNIVVNDNIVYLGTSKGIITFDVNLNTQNRIQPPIHITNFSIFDKDTTLNDFYELSYDQNSIQIDFIGLGYKCRGDMRYKYRMVGIDSNWVTTEARFARFPEIKKGDYEFQVTAVNEDNVESKEPAIIEFSITPPYWETWWFRSLAFIIGVSVIGGFFNFRYRTIRKREKMESDFKFQVNELRAQALQTQMNPHFIFNSMNAIQHFLTTQDKENAMLYLARFAKLIRFIFDHSKQKVISLRKELDFLNLYLSLEKLRFEDKVEVTTKIDDSIIDKEEEIHLPPLLIQPIVENAFKHGLFHKNGEGHLRITFSYNEPILECIIEDDGVGRKKAAEMNQWRKSNHKSSGIKSTMERIELLNKNQAVSSKRENHFEIIDLSDESGNALGTKVLIKLKNQLA